MRADRFFSKRLSASRKNPEISRFFGFLLASISLQACTSGTTDTGVVTDFDLDRYAGTWYEIARLDHRFERGLSNVIATYNQTSDGTIIVKNRGFNEEEGFWEEAVGTARFIDSETVGALEVSFFGPIYGAYNVIALDTDNYQYSLVAGPDLEYLWILSRTPELDSEITSSLVAQAQELGLPTDKLIFVDQAKNLAGEE